VGRACYLLEPELSLLGFHLCNGSFLAKGSSEIVGGLVRLKLASCRKEH
jgi:hypothetical protein